MKPPESSKERLERLARTDPSTLSTGEKRAALVQRLGVARSAAFNRALEERTIAQAVAAIGGNPDRVTKAEGIKMITNKLGPQNAAKLATKIQDDALTAALRAIGAPAKAPPAAPTKPPHADPEDEMGLLASSPKCAKCGEPNAEGAKHCAECGAPMPDPAKDAPDSEPPPAAPGKKSAGKFPPGTSQPANPGTPGTVPTPDRDRPGAAAELAFLATRGESRGARQPRQVVSEREQVITSMMTNTGMSRERAEAAYDASGFGPEAA